MPPAFFIIMALTGKIHFMFPAPSQTLEIFTRASQPKQGLARRQYEKWNRLVRSSEAFDCPASHEYNRKRR